MKKLLSIIICAIMVFSLLPLAAFAVASISEVDFSTEVEEGETVTREITELDPCLQDISLDVGSWGGYAKGYTVYLEAEHYYEFTATVRSEYGYYFDRAIAIYPETIESEEDWLDLGYGWSDDGVKSYTISCNYFPYFSGDSGYYKILTWGYALDEERNEMFDLLYEDFSFEEIDAYDVDYSEVIELDKTVTGTVNETDLFIGYNEWFGYSKGFTANLEAGQIYSFGIELTNNSGVELHADRAFAVFDSEGNEVYYSDGDAYIDPEESIFFSFSLPESGEYRILTWGYTVDNSDGTDVFGEDNITVAYTLSEAKPTEVVISTPDDLWDISFDFYNDVYDGKYVRIILANDIDMSEKYDFQAIDAHGVTIVEFEGKGHSITGLSDTLFYGADSLSVKDLTLEAELVIANEEDVENVGILVNYAEYLKLDNVFVDGLIDVEDCDDLRDLGGIAGEVGTLLATDSYSGVDICFLNTVSVWYVGGFAGYVWGDSSINNCGWSGTISLDDAALDAGDIGGFIGYSENAFIYIEDCTAIGYITFEEPIDPDSVSFNTVGGFIGVNYADLYINNCSADVDITAPGAYYVGGIIGRSEFCANIMNTYSDGIIVGGYYVGGFIGISYDDGTIANCYSVADVSGLNYIGGFIGKAAQDQMFINCYAAGSVTRLNDEYADAGTGMFLGVCEDECSFANVFCASDDNYGPCGDYANYMDNITVVDFGDEDEVASMEDMLNNYVDSSNEQELFAYELNNWAGRNDKNAPEFAEPPQYLLGDVDCDGDIDQYDYILAKRIHFNTFTPNDTQKLSGDVNKDGENDQYDYILIKRHHFKNYVIVG